MLYIEKLLILTPEQNLHAMQQIRWTTTLNIEKLEKMNYYGLIT